MLHILPIALREIMHAQHDCIRNLEIVKYCCSARSPFYVEIHNFNVRNFMAV